LWPSQIGSGVLVLGVAWEISDLPSISLYITNLLRGYLVQFKRIYTCYFEEV